MSILFSRKISDKQSHGNLVKQGKFVKRSKGEGSCVCSNQRTKSISKRGFNASLAAVGGCVVDE